MDYKYINQLLDRYWKAETSLEEEEILRAFFSQDELPAELKPYQALFSYEMGEAKQETLGDDFDQKMMATTAAALKRGFRRSVNETTFALFGSLVYSSSIIAIIFWSKSSPNVSCLASPIS